MSRPASPSFQAITADLLREWPLPMPDGSDGKQDRGQVLVIGGSREIPGAAVLAATASLRAGAGKLQSATTVDVARLVALALPEAMVLGLPQTQDGQIRGTTPALRKALDGADAVLVGPGMRGGVRTARLVEETMLATRGVVILDAGALEEFAGAPAAVRVVLTPHAGEMAHLLGMSREAVDANPAEFARTTAKRLRAVLVLKGATTFIAAPDGSGWCLHGNNPGLGTSGSGDVLAGLIAGLAARGATPAQAAAWGAFAHAKAGDQLAASVGRLGFLARELTQPIPRILEDVADPGWWG